MKLRLLSSAVVALCACGPPGDPLADRGIAVTTGATPGYVDDASCAGCHAGIAASYADVAMARSIYPPNREPRVERGLAPLVHAASGRSFELEVVGDGLTYRQWTVDQAGRRRNQLELPVDAVIGSGNHARTYVVRTASDELFQLPVAWYAESGALGMAPGYDRADHRGVLRQVRRGCLFCHATYAELPAGGDLPGAPDRYPTTPGPVGCQRCHGPGAEHTRLALLGDKPAARAAIVDPDNLDENRHLAVCDQCHLQPSVVLPGIRHFDQGDQVFRPGMAYTEARVVAEVVEHGREGEDIFEINHHAWRLRQSACFIAAARPVCTDCHDPHRKLVGAELAERVRGVCGDCHGGESGHACSDPGALTAGTSCTSCHFAKRRPEDVVRVVMTDHHIVRRPAPDALAPLAERDPDVASLRLLPWPGQLTGPEAVAHLAVGLARVADGDRPEVLEALRAAAGKVTAREFRLELGEAELAIGSAAAAEGIARELLTADPRDLEARELLAGVLAKAGELAAATAELELVLATDPARPEVWSTLGRVHTASGDTQAAVTAFERAVALRDLDPESWRALGDLRRVSGDGVGAEAAYRRALAVEPATAGAWLGLARVLLDRGDVAVAADELAHGVVLVRPTDAGVLLAALERAEAASPRPTVPARPLP